jgi:hypothetical protein
MASVGQKDLNKFSKTIVERHSYFIRNFQVSSTARRFKAVPGPYTIFFTSWTIVQEILTEVSVNLPLYIFNFVDFESLNHRARQGDGLVGMNPLGIAK